MGLGTKFCVIDLYTTVILDTYFLGPSPPKKAKGPAAKAKAPVGKAKAPVAKAKAPAPKAKAKKAPAKKKTVKEEPAAAEGGTDESDFSKAVRELTSAKPAKKKKTSFNRKVDSYVPGHLHYKVFEDWDCMLNQTNIGHNNNKFYVIQLIQHKQ